MNYLELINILQENSGKHFRILLPDGKNLPLSFHITEIGHVQKIFLDCGGTRRERNSCLLQIWVGNDFDHRIETQKMLGILKKGADLFPDKNIPVEMEYEDQIISQYIITSHQNTDTAVILQLAHKHTECLAPELCGLQSNNNFRLPALKTSK